MTGKRRKPLLTQRYSCPVSPERQERLGRLYNRDAMRQWTEKTGVADKLLNLIVAVVREREGLPTDPKTWRIVRLPEESQEQDD